MTAAWLAAALCAGVMGFAIQRGGTCTVAAIEEILMQLRAQRLLAMLEASLWVAGGLALAQLGRLSGSMPSGHAADAWTVAGGALLGLGACVNRACVFGAVARLGSGEWAYVATPLGYYAGCLSVGPVFGHGDAAPPAHASPAWLGAPFLAWAFLAFALWRLRPALRALQRPDRADWLRRRIWSPHAATIVIGVSFVLLLLLAGRWTYTDVLADLARAMRGTDIGHALPLLLLGAIYAGALAGGLTAGRWGATPLAAAPCLRCFAGGTLMGWGSLLIPGSNDGLVLIGIPLLQPYAWLGLASMGTAITAAMLAQRAWGSRKAATWAPKGAGEDSGRA